MSELSDHIAELQQVVVDIIERLEKNYGMKFNFIVIAEGEAAFAVCASPVELAHNIELLKKALTEVSSTAVTRTGPMNS
jgi:hypothetical protein